VLGLQAESVAAVVDGAAFADFDAVEEIAAVELDAGFGRQHFEHAAGARLVDGCREDRLSLGGLEHVVLVVAVGASELLVVGFDAGR